MAGSEASGQTIGWLFTEKYRFGIWSAHYHRCDVLAEIWLATRLPQLGKERVDLAEVGGEEFPVSSQERRGVNRSGRDERHRHILTWRLQQN